MTGEQVKKTSVICTRFSDSDEYLTELEDDRELIERGIVRVSKTAAPSVDGTATDVWVESGAIIAGRAVRLREFCGTLWGVGADEQVHGRARELQSWLEGELKRVGLEVRAGVWEAQVSARDCFAPGQMWRPRRGELEPRLQVAALDRLHLAVDGRTLCGRAIVDELDVYSDEAGLTAWNACAQCSATLVTRIRRAANPGTAKVRG
jgi:hypothetical protein